MNQKPQKKSKNKKRKRRIFWFNPPYDMAVKTKIGKKFLEIIDRSFPPGHVLRPYFNRHTVQISYRTLSNMFTKISVHNNKVTQAYNEANKPPVPPRRRRGQPWWDKALQRQVGQFIQEIRAKVEEARDGGNAGDRGDAPVKVIEDPHPHQPWWQQAGPGVS